jgi:hypothetical protein
VLVPRAEVLALLQQSSRQAQSVAHKVVQQAVWLRQQVSLACVCHHGCIVDRAGTKAT